MDGQYGLWKNNTSRVSTPPHIASVSHTCPAILSPFLLSGGLPIFRSPPFLACPRWIRPAQIIVFYLPKRLAGPISRRLANSSIPFLVPHLTSYMMYRARIASICGNPGHPGLISSVPNISYLPHVCLCIMFRKRLGNAPNNNIHRFERTRIRPLGAID